MPDYRVHLDAFEGPLDLLLYLIRRAEVDITDIPIASIADQYMSYLQGVERIDIELAGEFLVMAATLMEIKSRMLTPAARSIPTDGTPRPRTDEDPRAELVRQLLAYKQYRDAAGALEERKLDWEHRFPAARAGIDDDRLRDAIAANQDEGALELDDLSLTDLVEAFSQIVAAVNFDRLGDHTVTYDDTPLELHAEDILDRLKRDASADPVPLSRLFTGRTRPEMIGLFLATLELVKRRAVKLRQETPGGEITIGLREPESDPPLDASMPNASMPSS